MKRCAPLSVYCFLPNVRRFLDSVCFSEIGSKFIRRLLLYVAPHLKCVVALPVKYAANYFTVSYFFLWSTIYLGLPVHFKGFWLDMGTLFLHFICSFWVFATVIHSVLLHCQGICLLVPLLKISKILCVHRSIVSCQKCSLLFSECT